MKVGDKVKAKINMVVDDNGEYPNFEVARAGDDLIVTSTDTGCSWQLEVENDIGESFYCNESEVETT